MAGTVLVTGGAGYIGSHACAALLDAGYRVVALDNFCNGHPEALVRVGHICGAQPQVVRGDLRDRACLDEIFRDWDIDAVMHFGGLKAVGESVSTPLTYYENNVSGSLNLLAAMDAAACRKLVFSSSATVYGDPPSVPVREDSPLAPTSPYGWTKLMVERILTDWQRTRPESGVTLLRYFNPVGAHPSGHIGEAPQGHPNNLMPFVAQVAVGRRDKLRVFGDDYPTPDGTGVRDYIHVMDLVDGHVRALDFLGAEPGLHVFNLGTGVGVSVLELVRAFEQASGRSVPHEVAARRSGDIAACWADPGRANARLDWAATRTLAQMCQDSWRWQQDNPDGYA